MPSYVASPSQFATLGAAFVPTCHCPMQQVLVSFFAGLDTTAVSLVRILQLLGSTDGKKVVDELIQELNTSVTTNEGTETYSSAAASRDIFKHFPLLDAVVLESGR